MSGLIKDFKKIKLLIDNEDCVSPQFNCECVICGRKYVEYDWTYDPKLTEMCLQCIHSKGGRMRFNGKRLSSSLFDFYSIEPSGQRAEHLRMADEMTRAASVLKELESEIAREHRIFR